MDPPFWGNDGHLIEHTTSARMYLSFSIGHPTPHTHTHSYPAFGTVILQDLWSILNVVD